MADAYLYEFLYRGQPAGSAQPSAWHIQIAQVVSLPGQPDQVAVSGALTPAQAEATGFPLATVLDAINADALKQVATLTAAVAAANDRGATLEATVTAQTARATVAEEAATQLQASVKAQAATLAALNADLVASQATVADLTTKLAALQPSAS